MIRYAQHYCHTSSFAARNARILDVSLDSLVLDADGTRHRIPLEPPMESWRDARERMVKMDREATVALSKSDITIKEYRSPKGFQAVVFVAGLLTFALLSRRQNCYPGSFIHDNLLRYVPAFATFTAKVRPWVLYPMLAIHIAEAVTMARSRLDKHTVPMLSRLWFTWTISTLIEGVGSFWRYLLFVIVLYMSIC